MMKTTLALVASFTIGSLVTILLTRRRRRRRNPDIIWEGPSGLIGDTPIILLPHLSKLLGCTVLGKCEMLNPGGSSKDRIAKSIIEDAERRGLLTSGRVIEATVGSTGIALAWLSAAKDYICHICIPDDQSPEKYHMLESFGATVEKLRPASIIDPNQFVNKARRLAAEGDGFFADQFENLANFQCHYEGTGPEIYDQTNGRFDYLVMGCGTGGTLAGCTRYLKPRIPQLKVILADPQGSGLRHKVRNDTFFNKTEAEGKRSRHQVDTIVEGVGINRMTNNLRMLFPDDELPFVDDAIGVSDREAVCMARFMAMREGLFLGSSTCVNLVATVKLARRFDGKTIPTILTFLCDGGYRHMQKFWSNDYLVSIGLFKQGELESEEFKNSLLDLSFIE